MRLTFGKDCSRRVPAQRLKRAGGNKLGGLIWWIVVGLIAGWLAGKVMKGGGFGVLMDIVIGMVGAILGGWAFGLLGIIPTAA